MLRARAGLEVAKGTLILKSLGLVGLCVLVGGRDDAMLMRRGKLVPATAAVPSGSRFGEFISKATGHETKAR